jgi:hypothetical protein
MYFSLRVGLLSPSLYAHQKVAGQAILCPLFSDKRWKNARIGSVRKNVTGTTLNLWTRQENTPPALHAAQTDIGSQANHQPLIATAGMGFAQA